MSNDLDQFYETLGLSPGASQHDVKEAFRDLAEVWHPDRFAHDPRLQQKAEEKLKEINEAYEHLRNFRPQKSGARTSRPTQRKYSPRSQPQSPGQPGEPPPESPISSEQTRKRTHTWWILILLVLIVACLVYLILHSKRTSSPESASAKAGPSSTQAPPAHTPSPVPEQGAPHMGQREPHDVAKQAKERVDKVIDKYLSTTEPTPKSPDTPQQKTDPDESGRVGKKAQPVLPQQPIANPTNRGSSGSFFTIGSTKDEVIVIQGTPDSFTGSSFRYGTSDVHFKDGYVASWYNGYPRLRVRLLPTTMSSTDYITGGSTKDEVLSVQGTPDSFSKDRFRYGTSDVYFSYDRVAGWYYGYPRLKVRLIPSAPPRATDYFTIGSTRDDVIHVQGTPDSFSADRFRYGTSDVHFRDGRIVNWYSGYPKLKVRMQPGQQ